MVVVAVTGGFGTGKTTVAQMFGERGAEIIDVDRIAHEAESPGKPAWHYIVREFGSAILNSDQTINRPKLAALVFSDEKARQKLNSATHPEILFETKKQIQACQTRYNGLVVVDIPLLFEVNWQNQFDQIVVVKASDQTVLDRIMRVRHMTAVEINQRIQSQLPLEQKLKRADFVVDNDNGLSETRHQVQKIVQQLWSDK